MLKKMGKFLLAVLSFPFKVLDRLFSSVDMMNEVELLKNKLDSAMGLADAREEAIQALAKEINLKNLEIRFLEDLNDNLSQLLRESDKALDDTMSYMRALRTLELGLDKNRIKARKKLKKSKT